MPSEFGVPDDRDDKSPGSPGLQLLYRLSSNLEKLDDLIRGNGREGLATRLALVELVVNGLREDLMEMENEVLTRIAALEGGDDCGEDSELALSKEKTTRQWLTSTGLIVTQVCAAAIIIVDWIIPLFF